MTKLQELLAKLENLKKEAQRLNASDTATLEEVNAARDNIELIQAKISTQRDIEASDLALNEHQEPGTEFLETPRSENTNNTYQEAFMNVLIGRVPTSEQSALLATNALSSSSGEDGGFLIPIDQRTRVIELTRELVNLGEYANIETVGTLSGTRVIEKNADKVPLVDFDEGDNVPTMLAPQFKKITYTITDRGGILTIPNDLKNDSKGLIDYLNKWIAKKVVATRNHLIIKKLETLSKTAIAGFDDIKDSLNVSLDPAIEAKSKIYTNQTGFNFLDKLKDKQGNYIMQPNPVNPTQKMIEGKEVVKLSNTILLDDKTTGVKAPILIGALDEFITIFDRQSISILTTNIGGTAFVKNQTNTRVIERSDAQIIDGKAMIYGQMTIS